MWTDPQSTGLSQQRVLYSNGKLRFSKWESVLSTECVLCAGGCVAVSNGISSLWRYFLSLPFIWSTRETVGSRLRKVVSAAPPSPCCLERSLSKGTPNRSSINFLVAAISDAVQAIPTHQTQPISREEGRQVPDDWERTLLKINCAFQIPSTPETLIRAEPPDVNPNLAWYQHWSHFELRCAGFKNEATLGMLWDCVAGILYPQRSVGRESDCLSI